MTMWEWVLFAGAAVIALQILTSLMSYYHQLYRQEYLTELQKRQHEMPSSHHEPANAAERPEPPTSEQRQTRKAA